MLITIIALSVSIILQFAAAIVAISLTKVTRFNISWILISIALIFMAFKSLIELVPFLYHRYYEEILVIDNWISIVISVFVAVGIFFVKKIFNQLREAEIIRKNSERRILNAIIRTEERERQRFAKDIHDGLGPIMSTIKMSLSALSKGKSDKHELLILDNLTNMIDEGITEIKEISNNLSPHILNNFGLESAINSFINKINYSEVIKIDFTSTIHKERFNPNVESVIYRCLSELINNTIKHAGATMITILLSKNDNILSLQYSDNGKGFKYEDVLLPDSQNMGHYNIHSRLSSVNGFIDIITAEEQGFSANIHVKLN